VIDQMRREVQRALSGMRGAVRGVLNSLTLTQRVQRVNAEALAGEMLQNVELFQQFGFTSAPPAGTQVILLPLGGRTSASVVVATEHGAYRMQLNAQGEAAMYNQWGDHVWLQEDGTARVVARLGVDIVTPLTTISGDLEVGGNITAVGDVADAGGTKTMSGMRAVFNGHTQPVSAGTAQAPSAGM
jgi:phage baseplate assembly protein V